MWWFWIIASGIFFVAEMITVGFFVFWLGMGALLAMITSFFTDSLIIQTAVFVISSSLMLFFTKPLVDKYINKKKVDIKTNVFSIVGKTAIVIEDIDTQLGTGQITISGEVWSAKTNGKEIIKKDTKVEILDIEGVKAIVEPIYVKEVSSKN